MHLVRGRNHAVIKCVFCRSPKQIIAAYDRLFPAVCLIQLCHSYVDVAEDTD
jgi:hypothetical protein